MDCAAGSERRVDRRDGVTRFGLAWSSCPELSEMSSLLLGSMYETAPRLRLSVTAMEVQELLALTVQ